MVFQANIWLFLSLFMVAALLAEIKIIMESKLQPPFNELLKPRSIFAFMLYGTFCYLAIAGEVESRLVFEIVGGLMVFFYGMKMGEQKGGIKK